MTGIAGGAVWLASLAGYIWTVCPTVYVGDAGELIAAAAALGSPHPPGYPLFCLVNKGFMSVMPLGSLAFRANVCSAVLSAGTVWIVFQLVMALVRETFPGRESSHTFVWAATLSSLGLAWSGLFWEQATDAEVYALNSLAIAATLWTYLLWMRRPDRVGRLYAAAALYGVALAAHQIMLLFGPLLIAVAWRRGLAGTWSWTRLAGMALLVLCGMMVNLYLPIRALAEPPINWGHPDTFERLLDHLRRRQYGRLAKQSRSWFLLAAQIKFLGQTWIEQFGWWWIPVAGLGGYWLSRASLVLSGLLHGGILATSLGFAVLFNFPDTAASYMSVSVFFTPSYMLSAVLMGVGLAGIAARWTTWAPLVWTAAVGVGPVWGFTAHHASVNLSNITVAHDYGLCLLSALPRGSTLIASGDNSMFSLAYLQLVEGRRSDVTVYDDSGYIFPNIYGWDFLRRDAVSQEAHRLQMQKLVMLQASGPVFYTLENTKHDLSGVTLDPLGLVQEARLDANRSTSSRSSGQAQAWRRFFIRGLESPTMERGDYILRNLLAQFYYQWAGYEHQQGHRRLAERAYRKSDRVGYDNEWIQSNLGVILMNQGAHAEAVERCRRAVEINPQSGEAYLNLGAALDAYAESLRGVQSDRAGAFEAEARKAYERAIELKPTYHTAFFNLGNTFMSQGKFPEAIEQYQKALSSNPRSVEAHINLGNALDAYADQAPLEEKSRVKAAAMEEYRRALSLNPESVEAHINLGTAYFNGGQRALARREYEEAVRLDPKSVEGRFNLGNVDLLEGRLEEAMGAYQRVLELNPGYFEAYFAWGVALEKSGRIPEAMKRWEQGLRMQPNNEKFLAKLKRYRR